VNYVRARNQAAPHIKTAREDAVRQPTRRDVMKLGAGAPRGEWLLIGLFVAMIAAIPFVGFYPTVTAFMLILLATRTSLRWMLVPYVAALLVATWALSRVFNLPLP
jgi:hypothetical protein